MFIKILISSLMAIILAACGTNPVTGKRQITLMSPEQEVALGKQHYIPSQQSQGGAYLIDASVNDYVNRVGQTLAKHSAQPDLPYEFVVLNNDVPNAWALPGGKIAINRGLLVLLEDEAQLAAVLGHEVVHAAARHSAEQQATTFGIQILATAALTQTDNKLYQQAAAFSAGSFQAKYSRKNELESDKYGMNYMSAAGYDVYRAVELQETFVKLSEESGQKSDFFNALFASHPPSRERVAKNRNRADRFPKGKRNRNTFLKATKQLRRDQKAYDKHLAAIKAASKQQWSQAIALTNQAIKMQPKEARFQITKGRLLSRERKNKQALHAFNTAVRKEPSYYATYLHRGVLHHKTKSFTLAEKDLLTSYQLLPTQPASFYLGELEQRKKNYQQAIRYYRDAAKGGGNMGKTASLRIQQLSKKS